MRMTDQQQFFAGIESGSTRVSLGGPFPTRAEADAWAHGFLLDGTVVTWGELLTEENRRMAETKTRTPAFEELYEQLLNLPEETRAEIDDGRIVIYPLPSRVHVFAASSLGIIIGAAFQRGVGGPGGWWIFHEPDIRFGDLTRRPDLAGWRRERMPTIEEKPNEQPYYFEVIPDWICEFISPRRERNDREIKRGLYARHGVQYYWLGDPRRKTLDTFVLDRGELKPTASFRDNDTVAAPPFHELPFKLGELWWG